MRHSLKTGFSFGITSGVITTLGLIVGLNAVTNSRVAVIGGILTIAIADAFSDALGIHLSEESEDHHSAKEIWQSTFFTFVAKFIFAMTFMIPILMLPLNTAIIISIIWGFILLGTLSFLIARSRHANVIEVISEHVLIGLFVIGAAYYIGSWIAVTFV